MRPVCECVVDDSGRCEPIRDRRFRYNADPDSDIGGGWAAPRVPVRRFRFHEAVKETPLQTLRADAEADALTADTEGERDGTTAAVGEALEPAVAPAPSPAASQTALALADLMDGARAFHLWGLLGWHDIRRRYRRSILGPFWLTISMGVLVAALGTLYGTLLKVESAQYVPFLALGFVVWTLISSVFTDGCTAFITAEGIIKQTNLPLTVHVYRMVWCNFLIFCHNAAIFVVVAVLFAIWPGWTGLLALPGLVLLCLNAVWVGLLLGIVSARFRDVPPIVASIVRILFFVTPIIWMPELMPGRALMLAVVLDFNPFFHFVELVRAPLLGQVPELTSWLAVSGITLGGWLLALAMFRRYRRRIAYWV